LREADLDRHLSNDRQTVDKTEEVAVKPGPKTQPKNKDADGSKSEISEFGAKNDYQLNQALNLLKGMNILHGK
jgi:carboxyl-terminal processing protease